MIMGQRMLSEHSIERAQPVATVSLSRISKCELQIPTQPHTLSLKHASKDWNGQSPGLYPGSKHWK